VPLLNNESLFLVETLPENFVFLGGGPISCELAQAFRFLGSEVTILNADGRLLGREIQEASDVVETMFKEDGMEVVNRMKLTKIQNGHVFYTVDDKELSKKADALFVGIGRVLNSEGLALEKAGIKQEENGKLIINEYLETTNPHVVAIGDIAGSFMFTHAAEEHAKVVINNMLSPFKKKSPSTLAWVTYTSKEVATFGKSEATLNEQSIPYMTHMLSFDEEDRSITDGEKGSFLKVYVDKEGNILGGAMVAEDAGELVQDLLTLHYNNLSLKALYNKVYPYPTKSRINRRLALIYMGSRLSKSTHSIIRFLFRIFS
jgi:pyruvate/2-oxoglutarate dehydrogenase complex dihydrolipoamide dehydrogenase (E3) component